MDGKETEEALEEARRGDLKQFDSVEALFADLNADDTPKVSAVYSRMSSKLSSAAGA